jgi:hypothetical protein
VDIFGPMGNPAFGLDDNNPTFYPPFCTVVAPDRPPEGDRYAFATWGDVVSSYRHEDFIPWGYAATDAPVATEQDNMLIGRSLVNPTRANDY